MELGSLALVAAVAVPLLLGALLLRGIGIGPRVDPLAYLGWTWLAGTVAIGLLEALRLLLALETPHIPVTVGALLAGLFAFRPRRPAPEVIRPTPAPRLERAFFALVVALVLVLLLQRILASSFSAIVADDEANFWSLRAKVLFDGHAFTGPYSLALQERLFNNANYPLLNSLLQLWVFDCAGHITHIVNRVPIQLCSVALVLCSASAMRRVSRPWIAAVLLLLLVTCAPLESAVRRANADVMVALGGLVATDAWLRLRRARELSWIALASLATAFLLWSKREGTLLFVASILALGFLAWRRGTLARPRLAREAWVWIAFALAIQLGTLAHNTWLGARGSHEVRPEALSDWSRYSASAPLVLRFLAQVSVRLALHAIPAVFFLAALLVPRPREEGLSFLPLACLGFVLGVVAALLQGNTEYLLDTASVRVLAQLLPLELLWLSAVAHELVSAPRPAGAPAA